MSRSKYDKWLGISLQEDIITYDAAGKTGNKTKTLFFKAPTLKNVQYIKKLEQLFFKSMVTASAAMSSLVKGQEQSQSQSQKKDKITVEEVKSLISAGDIDFMQYKEVFEEFMLSGNCAVDEKGEILFVPLFLDQMESISDFENLIYTYIVNFMQPSLS